MKLYKMKPSVTNFLGLRADINTKKYMHLDILLFIDSIVYNYTHQVSYKTVVS